MKGWEGLLDTGTAVLRRGESPHPFVRLRTGSIFPLRRPLRNAVAPGEDPSPRPSCMFRVMAGQSVALLVKETVTQLGRPAKSILEPEQLPGQVQARIGKDGPRRE